MSASQSRAALRGGSKRPYLVQCDPLALGAHKELPVLACRRVAGTAAHALPFRAGHGRRVRVKGVQGWRGHSAQGRVAEQMHSRALQLGVEVARELADGDEAGRPQKLLGKFRHSGRRQRVPLQDQVDRNPDATHTRATHTDSSQYE